MTSTAPPPAPHSSGSTSSPSTTTSTPPGSSHSVHAPSSREPKFRASLGGDHPSSTSRWHASSSTSSNHLAHPPTSAGTGGGGQHSNQFSQHHNPLRATSPGRASTGTFGPRGLGGGGGGAKGQGIRPSSELMALNQSQGVFHSAETEAIDRWFEDLQHYEATLEEMAAASLDANFKEELSAIEQWFRVLSEAERTAALYSLLQSSTQMQMRFFITVLQQMARQDPTQAALLSPANPSQQSLESQMEAKLASLNLSNATKSPSSPMIRQFARSSLGPNPASSYDALGASAGYLSPNVQQQQALDEGSLSPSAASTLAAQRAKLKASARTSAPANLLLNNNSLNGAGPAPGMGEGLKSPLWSKEETVRERSPSPRPKSTGSTGDAPNQASMSNSQSFLRSPALDASFGGADGQLSPLVGGNWASMVNTPLVPMFGKNGETMEPGNFGSGPSPNPNRESLGQRLENWRNTSNDASNGSNALYGNTSSRERNEGGIVLDDVRKFRRSARVSGGALSGMYDEAPTKDASTNSLHQSATTAQRRVQDQLQAVQQLKNMQQSALSLGLGSLPSPSLNGSLSSQQQQQAGGGSGSRVGSSGALNSPGLQQTAMQAQQNWRNSTGAPTLSPSYNTATNQTSSSNANVLHQQQQQQYGHSPSMNSYGSNQNSDQFGNMIGLGTNLSLPQGLASPASPGSANHQQQQAQQQLASLIALQQQMMQQQQQLQSLASGAGISGALGGLGMMGTGANLSPNMAALGMMGLGGGAGSGGQISPRLGGGGSPMNGGGYGGMGLGMGLMGGMPSPRRSPRPHDRSPASFPMSSHRSGNGSASSSSQLPSGSGSNPDEPLDFSLLGDTPAWLRSLRLHKYTPNFERVGWKEMCVMTEEDLEKRGVSALGARRKLLKVFETVRAKTGMASPPSAPAMDPSTSSDSTTPNLNDGVSAKTILAEEDETSPPESSKNPEVTSQDDKANGSEQA